MMGRGHQWPTGFVCPKSKARQKGPATRDSLAGPASEQPGAWQLPDTDGRCSEAHKIAGLIGRDGEVEVAGWEPGEAGGRWEESRGRSLAAWQ